MWMSQCNIMVKRANSYIESDDFGPNHGFSAYELWNLTPVTFVPYLYIKWGC